MVTNATPAQPRVALVAGAGSGIGAATAVALKDEGWIVVGADTGFANAPGGFDAQIADLRQEQAAVQLLRGIGQRYGRLDALVHAVTEIVNAPIAELSVEQWERCEAANSRAAFLVCRESIKLMRRSGGGAIVVVTTIGAQHPVLIGNAAYSSSKAAAGMLVRNIALECAADGITANAVLPGAVLTEESQHSANTIRPSGPGADPARHLRGFMKPADVVPLLQFLCGDGARYITGQSIAVDGGFQVG